MIERGQHPAPPMTEEVTMPGTITTGRYRILRADLDALTADGARHGDRDALDALRVGLPADSWPGSDRAERFAVDALYRLGVDWDRLDPNAKASVVSAWIDGYRPAYSDTYYDAVDG